MTQTAKENAQLMREDMAPSTITPNLQSILGMLENKDGEVQKRLTNLMGDRAMMFTQAVRNVLIAPENKALRECDAKSIMRSCMACATSGLTLDPAFGQAAIVPFTQTKYINGAEVKVKKAVFMPMKNGIIQLANNSGMIQRIMASPVYEGDIRSYNPFTGDMEYNQEPHERTKLIGYMAYLRFINGADHYVYMTVQELEDHGRKYSQTFYKKSGLWQTNKTAMYEKTVLKRLLTKWGSLDTMANARLMMALKFDMATPSDLDIDNAKPEYVDGTEYNEVAVEEQEAEDVTDK